MTYNILVTGGAGYLGSTMVPDLLAAGHKVTVLDNFLFKQASLNHVCHHPNFSVVKGDIRVEKVMAPLMKKADVIIPLAALVGAPLCTLDPVGATTVNHDAITLMLKHLSKQQIVLMPTTNSAYGTGDENNHCTENSPLRPISQYAIEKVAIEKELMQHPNAISFRLATVPTRKPSAPPPAMTMRRIAPYDKPLRMDGSFARRRRSSPLPIPGTHPAKWRPGSTRSGTSRLNWMTKPNVPRVPHGQ